MRVGAVDGRVGASGRRIVAQGGRSWLLGAPVVVAELGMVHAVLLCEASSPHCLHSWDHVLGGQHAGGQLELGSPDLYKGEGDFAEAVGV